jgi:hypothetical protein
VDSQTPASKSADLRSNQILGVTMLGLGTYEIAEAIPTLVTVALNYGHRIHDLSDFPWANMSSSLIRLAIGVGLILANRAVVKMLRKLSDGPAEENVIASDSV